MWEDNRNHRWIPPICERRAAFSSHPPTSKHRYIFALLSVRDRDIKEAVKAGREGASDGCRESHDVRSSAREFGI